MNDSPKASAGPRRKALEIGALTALLIVAAWIAYTPVLDRDYLFADDYPQFARRLGLEPCAQMGRPLLGIAFWLLPLESDSLAYFRGLRAFSIAGSILVVLAVYLSVLRRMFPPAAAFAAAVGCLAIPTFQVCAGWSTAYPLPWACVAAIAAGVVARAMFERPIKPLPRALGLTFGVLLELVALATYQPCAMCFWLVLLPIVCTPEFLTQASIRRRAYQIAAVGFVSLVLYFGLFKLSAYAGWFTPLPRAAFETEILDKLVWFVSKPLVRCVAVWGLYELRDLGVAAFGLCAIVAIVHYYRRQKATEGAQSPSLGLRIWQATVIAGLLLLSYLPVLLVAEDWASYRSMIALAITVYVLLAVAVFSVLARLPERSRRWAGVAACLAPLVALAAARDNVTSNVAELNRREFGHLITALQSPNAAEARRIHVVMSPFSRGRNFPCRSDEFGVLCASRPAWTTAMVLTGLRVLGRSEEIPITTAEPGATPVEGPQVLVVNMNDLNWVR